jgi:hypothetical protein
MGFFYCPVLLPRTKNPPPCVPVTQENLRKHFHLNLMKMLVLFPTSFSRVVWRMGNKTNVPRKTIRPTKY